jgi:hypothetical protein
MGKQLATRTRSSLLGDLRIFWLGVWGFLLQCLKSCGRTAKGPHELESDE